MRLILLEFNELSPLLTEKFMNAGKLPNFKRFHDEAQVSVTEAETVAPDLEPWIQWVTVHSGIPYQEHQIHHLGDGYQLEQKCLWDLASDAGKSVWVCGSMNINYQRPINGWVLPDPWTRKLGPYPEEILEPYSRFVSANVQEHTSGKVPLSRSEQIGFLKFMVRHGLRPSTVGSIMRQLASERFSNAGWKRAVILDQLQLDLFRWYYKRAQPDFATFFLNSTAHYQHLYWRNMEPEHFKVKPEPGEQEVYQEAILFGYQQMDKMLPTLLSLAGPDTAVVLLTALSQQPSVKYEDVGGKVLYRPHDFQKFLEAVGVEGGEVTPVMAEEFNIDFPTEEAARAAEAKLEALQVDGKPAMRSKREGTGIKSGCLVWRQLEPDANLQVDGDGRTVPFFDLFYKLDLMKSGEHHPDGMMWIRTPDRRPSAIPEKVPLVSVAPTILELAGVQVPSEMRGEPVLT
jgi:hypothetical protein